MSLSAFSLVRSRVLPSVRGAAPIGQAHRAYSSSSSSRATTSARGLKPKSAHDQLCSERAIKGDAPNNTHLNNTPVLTKSAKTPSSAPTTATTTTSSASPNASASASATPTMTSPPATTSTPSNPPTASTTDPATGLSKMFLASPVAARLKDKEAALRQQAETVKSLPAMAGLLKTAERFDSIQRQQTSMLRRATVGALPWAPQGGQRSYLIPMSFEGDAEDDADMLVEARHIARLPDPEDLPVGSKQRHYLSLCEFDQATVDNTEATFQRLADMQALETNQRYIEHVGARVRWDRAIRLADEKLGRGTLLNTPYPEIDTTQLDARLPLEQSAALWLDSTRRKRKSKMRKHKHRKLMKKMRARKIRQGRIRS